MKKSVNSNNRKFGFTRSIGLAAIVLIAAVFTSALPNLRAQAADNSSFFGLADLFDWRTESVSSLPSLDVNQKTSPLKKADDDKSFAPTAAVTTNGGSGLAGTYPDLASAITALNAATITSPVVINATGTETTPNGGFSITATGTVTNTITISGGGATTLTAPTTHTAGALNDAIFKIIGGDFITISGFTMLENAANTTTAAGTNNMTEFGVALFYASATNGAQNDTIQNNTITLNRTYQNTFGIYANATHTATSVTTSATATGTAGGNSGLKIYSNNINNVNNGMVVVGPTAVADNNNGIDIGGASAATANSITNYGTTGTFSAYANVSGTVNGILVRNSINANISFNTVTSSVGGTTAGTLNGIQISASSTAPTPTFTTTVNNNNISLQSALTAGTIIGITQPSGSASATSSFTANNNNFGTFGHTVASPSGTITFITSASTHLNNTISNNTFTNINLTTTGSVTFISNNITVPAGGSQTINGNLIVTAFNKSGAGGTVTGITSSSSSTTGTFSWANNNFSNITLTGATGLNVITNTDGGTVNHNITGNTINNVVGGTSAIVAITSSFGGGGGSGNLVSGNTITNISNAGAITGISIGSSGTTSTVTGNTIGTLAGTGASLVVGITSAAPTSAVISKNKIYDLSGSSTSGTVSGIAVSAGTLHTISNNLIGDLRTPAANAANPLIGLNITGGTTVNAYFNTVYLNASSTGALFGSSAVSASTTPTVELRNNIFFNGSSVNGTGLAVAYRRSSTTLTSYSNSSNNNLFYAGSPSATSLIYNDGTNSDMTLTTFKTRVTPRDSASVTENVSFSSTTGSNLQFLHINTGTATFIESGGATISGITDDFDGDTRTGTPDIGADEFVGISAGDFSPPSITYTALSDTGSTTSRTLTATITDATGVASGAGAPLIYYRKGTTGAYISAAATGITGSSYTFTINYAALGSVTGGDVIQYYVAAQDTASPANGATNPAGGSGINPPGSTAPTTPNQYSILFVINTFPYLQDFETNSNGWSAGVTVGTASDWELGTFAKTQLTAPHSGAKAWVTKLVGNYSLNTTSTLSSPIFDFSTFTSRPTLSFWHNFKTEAGFDAGVLEYSTDGGSVWTKVDANLGTGATFNTTDSTNWYNSSSTSGAVTGVTQPKWSGTSTAYTGHAAGWIQSSTLLPTAVVGQANVRFRWRFGSETSTVDEGWAVDDIGIAPPNPGIVQFNPTAYTGTENTTATITVTRTGGSFGAILVGYATGNGTATGGTCGTNDYVTTSGTLSWADGETTAKTFNVMICPDGVVDPGETVNLTLSSPTGGATIGANGSAVLTITDVPPPVSGNYNIPGDFNSLTNAGGIFERINSSGASGNTIINIAADLSGETGAVALNEIAGGFTVKIQPSGVRMITGSGATGIIRLNGADNVTIDGDDPTTGATDKGLTISNTNTGGAVIQFVNAATNNTVKNCVLQGVSTATTNGVVFFSTTATGTVGNNTNTIQNNDIRGGATAQAFGIYNLGTGMAKNTDNNIVQNRIFNFSNTGIYDNGNSANFIYTSNEIFEMAAQNTALNGFRPNATTIDGFTFQRNYIHDLTTSSTGTVYGIHLFDASGSFFGNIINNFISLSEATPLTLRGIYDQTATSEKYNIWNNSIYIGGTVTGASNSEAYYYSIASLSDVRSNIFVNARTGGTGKHYAYRTLATLSALTSDYNDIYNTGGTGNVFGNNGTADAADLATWQMAPTVGTGKDANSKSADPLFVSAANLHVTATSPVQSMGTPIAGVTVDFDGDARPATPDIGADEITAAVNNPPTISAGSGSFEKGRNYTSVQIATVSDDGGNGGVVVTVTSANPSNGVTISGITNTNGTITANFSLACGAQDTTFTLSASDNVNPPVTATYSVQTQDSQTAASLQFIQQPTNANSGATIVPPVTVGEYNACGVLVATGGDFITVAINSGTGTLNGTTGINASNGVATFSNLSITAATTGAFTLSATSAGLTGANSNSFTITNAPAGTIQFGAATYSIGEAGGAATLTVTRTGGSNGAVTANYALAGGTATGGATCATGVDYINTGGSVTFADGDAANKTFTVAVCDDSLFETPNETFNATISIGSGAVTLGTPNPAVVTITENDSAPSLQFNSATYSNADDFAANRIKSDELVPSAATITVTRTGATENAVSVNYAAGGGSATGGAACAAGSGVDYVSTNGTLNFAAGVTMQTFNITVCTDNLFEGDETVNLALTSPTNTAVLGTPNTAVLTLTDNETIPTLQFSSATYSNSDDLTRFGITTDDFAPSAATITVTRTGATDNVVSVSYATMGGTATGGASCTTGVDYITTSGMLNFAFGETSKTFSVTVCTDALFEGDETVNLILTNPVGGALGTPNSATLTIVDNDAQPALQFSSTTYTVGEGGGSATVSVTRTGATDNAVSVNYAASNGTATGGASCSTGVDYTTTSGTLSFASGVTNQTFSVPICDDVLSEGSETVNLALTSPTGGVLGTPNTAVLTITDNDGQPTLQFSSATNSVGEGGGTITLTVTRTGAVGNVVSVDYATAGGAATSGGSCTAGVDFIAASGSLSFAAGVTSQTFNVTICDDSVFESSENFTATLSNAGGGAAIGMPSTETITITDNDTAGITVSPTTVSVTEGGATADYTIVLNTQPTANVTISIMPDAQLTVSLSSVTFTPANYNVPRTVTVTAFNDTVIEGNHTGTITQSAASSDAAYNNAAVSSVTANITDNDFTPTVSLSVNPSMGTETGQTAVTVTATASSAVSGNQTINLGVSGTGITSGDYTLSAATITILNGQTTGSVTFTIVDDLIVEGTETATLTISSPSAGITLGSPTMQNVTITDNDVAPTISSGSAATFTIGAAGTFTITANGTPTPMLSVSGTLPNGVTFVNNGNGTATLSGTPAAGTAGTYPLTFTANNGVTPNATQNFTLTVGAQAALSINDVTLNEGNSGTTTFTFTVSLSAPAQAGGITFNIATADNTATAGSDYTAKSLTGQTIAAGNSTYSFAILVNGDTTVEPTETFFVNVTNVTGATVADGSGTGTITNDDAAAPTVNLSIAPTSGSETGTTLFTATATASAAVTGNQTVNFALTGGSATGADFTAIPMTITILSGQTTGTATFSVVDDSLVEGTETGTFAISSPSAGMTLGATTMQTVTITDNDSETVPPVITYTAFGNTNSTVNPTLAVTISDNVAVPTSGMLVPRIYYRKNSGVYFSTACVLASGTGQNGSWNCTVDYALVGGAASGNAITYFVVAQDTSGNLASNPAGAAGTDVNNLTAAPPAPNFYSLGMNSVIPAGTYTFLNVGTATLGGNVTIVSNLTLNGIVNNGGFTVTVGENATVTRNSGYIIGSVKKVFGQIFAFGGGINVVYHVGTANGYSPVTAFVTSRVIGSELTVIAKQGTQPNLPTATTLQRYWTLTETGTLTANLQFNYLPTDTPGVEANYQVIRVENGTPTFYPGGTVDTLNDFFQANNVSDFSDWTAGESITLAPTAATASINGRVVNASGRGVENATVTMTGGSLTEPISVSTDNTGRYRLPEVPSGETYILNVSSKRYRFSQPTIVISINENLANVNFVANGN